jgi:hypothetical protein
LLDIVKSNDGNGDGNKAEAPSSSSEHEFETNLSRLIELSEKPRLNEERERSERDDLLSISEGMAIRVEKYPGLQAGT